MSQTCRGTRKNGGSCRSTLVLEDGFCVVHSPSKRFDPVETGRKAGRASGKTRRQLSRNARERLRQQAESDEEIWAKVKAAYIEGLEVTTADGNPDYRARVQAADSFLAQMYGKPVQPTEELSDRVQIVISPPGGEFSRAASRTPAAS